MRFKAAGLAYMYGLEAAWKIARSAAILLCALVLLPIISLIVIGLGESGIIAAIAIPIAAIGGAVLIFYPFVGLALIVLFTQLDALLSVVAHGLPGMKLLTAVTLAGVALTNAKENRADRLGPSEPALKFAVLFGLALALAILFAIDRVEAFDYGMRIASLIVLFYLVVRLTSTQRRLEIIIGAILVSTLLSSLVILYDSHFGSSLLSSPYDDSGRSGGATSYDATTAAAILMAGATLSLVLFVRTSRFRLLTGATALVGFSGVFFSLSRSASLLSCLAIVYVLWSQRKSRHFPAIALGAVICSVAAIPLIPDDLVDRLSDLIGTGGVDWTLDRRWGYQLIGLDLWMRYPLFGIGPGNFPMQYLDFDYRWMPGRTLDPRRLHNMYLSVASQIGLFGIAAFTGLIIAAWRRCRGAMRHGSSPLSRAYAEAVLVALALFLIVNLTLPGEINKYTWIFLGLAVAAGRVGVLPPPTPDRTDGAAALIAIGSGHPGGFGLSAPNGGVR